MRLLLCLTFLIFKVLFFSNTGFSFDFIEEIDEPWKTFKNHFKGECWLNPDIVMELDEGLREDFKKAASSLEKILRPPKLTMEKWEHIEPAFYTFDNRHLITDEQMLIYRWKLACNMESIIRIFFELIFKDPNAVTVTEKKYEGSAGRTGIFFDITIALYYSPSWLDAPDWHNYFQYLIDTFPGLMKILNECVVEYYKNQHGDQSTVLSLAEKKQYESVFNFYEEFIETAKISQDLVKVKQQPLSPCYSSLCMGLSLICYISSYCCQPLV